MRLPHRFLTFSLPKCLRVFFRDDRRLFSGMSRLIFDTNGAYFTQAVGTPVEIASVLCFQSFGEFFRWNSHLYAIVLEGGFDAAGARLIAKVYEVDSMVCPRCGAPMKMLAILSELTRRARLNRPLQGESLSLIHI